jgi:hypothetical protein
MVRLPKSKSSSSIDLLKQTFSAQRLFRQTSCRAEIRDLLEIGFLAEPSSWLLITTAGFPASP